MFIQSNLFDEGETSQPLEVNDSNLNGSTKQKLQQRIQMFSQDNDSSLNTSSFNSYTNNFNQISNNNNNNIGFIRKNDINNFSSKSFAQSRQSWGPVPVHELNLEKKSIFDNNSNIEDFNISDINQSSPISPPTAKNLFQQSKLQKTTSAEGTPFKDVSSVEQSILKEPVSTTKPQVSTNRNNGNSSNNKNINNLDIDFTKINEFLTSSTPKNVTIQTQIKRNKSGLNRLYPSYEVILNNTSQFLMSAKKKTKNKTSNYYVSSIDISKKVNKNDVNYLGKVRSNFVGTEFVLYDNGRNPKDVSLKQKKPLRKELVTIMYEANILGTKGPRKMTVLIPDLDCNDNDKWQPKQSNINMLLSSYKQNVHKDLLVLQNKSPKWNEQIGAYVLNFSGRVTMASVKNFQLVFPGEDDVILQFGRIGKETFTMDFKHPLSPLQAFGICLSSFDNKLACE